MTNKLKEVFEKASRLSEEDQNDIAAALQVVVNNALEPEDEAEWDAIVGSARSHVLLDKMVKNAQQAVERGEVSNSDPGDLVP